MLLENNRENDKYIEIAKYLFLTFGIPLVCILIAKISWIEDNAFIGFILYGVEGASPLIAAIILVLVYYKREGLRKYLYDKYINNLCIAKCMLGVLVPLLVLTCAKVVSVCLGDATAFLTGVSLRKLLIIAWALIAEELGWRGFLQEKLSDLFYPKYIPIMTGIIWSLWHYHFILSGTMTISMVPFVLGCIFESYGYYALTRFAKGNIVPASIWHFTGNLMFNMYRFDPQWHNGETLFYWIASLFYAVNILLFVLYVKRSNWVRE